MKNQFIEWMKEDPMSGLILGLGIGSLGDLVWIFLGFFK